MAVADLYDGAEVDHPFDGNRIAPPEVTGRRRGPAASSTMAYP